MSAVQARQAFSSTSHEVVVRAGSEETLDSEDIAIAVRSEELWAAAVDAVQPGTACYNATRDVE